MHLFTGKIHAVLLLQLISISRFYRYTVSNSDRISVLKYDCAATFIQFLGNIPISWILWYVYCITRIFVFPKCRNQHDFYWNPYRVLVFIDSIIFYGRVLFLSFFHLYKIGFHWLHPWIAGIFNDVDHIGAHLFAAICYSGKSGEWNYSIGNHCSRTPFSDFPHEYTSRLLCGSFIYTFIRFLSTISVFDGMWAIFIRKHWIWADIL